MRNCRGIVTFRYVAKSVTAKRLANFGLDKDICRVIILTKIVAESFRHAPGVGARGIGERALVDLFFSSSCVSMRFWVHQSLCVPAITTAKLARIGASGFFGESNTKVRGSGPGAKA
jgi:hypothetical protein